jgi:hypothetical protein
LWQESHTSGAQILLETTMATQAADQARASHAHVSVRVDRSTYARLVELAREQHLSIAQLVARAVDTFDRVSMAEESNAAYARLREEPAAWAEWQSEIAVWDAALLDGTSTDGHSD